MAQWPVMAEDVPLQCRKKEAWTTGVPSAVDAGAGMRSMGRGAICIVATADRFAGSPAWQRLVPAAASSRALMPRAT